MEDGLVEHQVLLNIVNEHGIIEQRQVILDQSVVPQSQLYFGQEDVEGGGHEVVFEDSEILEGMEVTTATQTIVVKSLPAGYKPDLEDASDVESIQIVENVNEEDYIEISKYVPTTNGTIPRHKHHSTGRSAAVQPTGTAAPSSFLSTVPALIICFFKLFGL